MFIYYIHTKKKKNNVTNIVFFIKYVTQRSVSHDKTNKLPHILIYLYTYTAFVIISIQYTMQYN